MKWGNSNGYGILTYLLVTNDRWVTGLTILAGLK